MKEWIDYEKKIFDCLGFNFETKVDTKEQLEDYQKDENLHTEVIPGIKNAEGQF